MKKTNPLTYLAAGFMGLILAILAGCSDWYSEPAMLADQKSLSAVYEDRPLYSSVYYEGQTTHEGIEVHVFVVRAINKFTPESAYYIYYLPVAGMTIATDVGRYAGEENLRRTHLLEYDHDRGQFSLVEDRRSVEVITANFTEAYTLKESRCIKATEEAKGSPDSYPLAKYAAETCFWSGNYAQSKVFTQLLKDNMDHFDAYTTRGQMLHDYYTLMGRHLLQEGRTQEANQHLLQSVELQPSPAMSSFGPNMELAMDLLKAGETATVLEYLDACAGFWDDEPIRIWKQKINAGRMPILNQHSWDGELDVASTNVSPCLAAFQRNSAKEAFSICQKAAETGSSEAQNLLGIFYETGKGTEQDFPQAMHWYQLAADQGESLGQYNLAQLYRTGKAGVQDLGKAVHYYALSAE
ncbi:MAG TPA: tetratricopeptide repeat protein, partial [Xanthomonadales bacterium]